VEHTPASTRASSSLSGELPLQAHSDSQSGQTGLGLHSNPALPATRQQPPRHTSEPHRAPTPSSGGIAVLSFFCGIGTTFLALRDLDIHPVLLWSWETDPECRRVTSAHSPYTRHWGDALSFDPCQVAALLHSQCPADTLVLVCSSPPCTDFSQVRTSPPGLQGQEGCKFRQWCQWLSSFRKTLKLQHVFLVENVLPSGEVHRELDKLVGHNSFVVDAASWGVVSRPRLWWSNVLTPPTLDSNQPPVVLAGLARWRRYNRCWQLVPSSNLFPKQNAADCPYAVFHPDVVANRWAAASRQFPPYQYRTRALVTIQGRLTTPDAATRECKMLGNSWHLPTARFLLFVLLAACNVIPVTSGPVEAWFTASGASCSRLVEWALRIDSVALNFPPHNPWRQEVVRDVQSLREDLQDEQEVWLQSAPHHVRLVYRQGGDKFVLQPLVVLHLLRLFEFPGVQDLADELQFGFKVLGPLPPGTNWDVRQDGKYSRPLTKSQFASLNSDHKKTLAQEQGGSEHAPAMLAEVHKEMLKTRFQGPFVPAEVADSPAAFGSRAFPVVQQDKVRRADDWRRSGHNSTVFVLDSPPYAGTQTVLTSVQAAADFGRPVLAALDHDGAYRALPVRNPDECFVFVPSEKGPEVFQHLVLPFGGTGSVWAYLRIADVICLITLVLAYIPASHFVDDFYFSEPDKTADSAFECFCQLQSLLGRLEKLQSLLERILSDDSLTPEEAAHLAGVNTPRPHVLYADAFVTLAGQRWAYRATVPRHLLARAATTKAFIFWLEAIGQIVSIAAAARVLSGDVLCFVDNVASEHALKKGYSKDPLLTNLLGEWEISDSLGCSRLYPDFDGIWDLLFEMTKQPVDPKSDLFGELVNLLA
ncbi:unnamed protein product, partial [Symbiodinium necroappetens]